jgi:hypothetical protein
VIELGLRPGSDGERRSRPGRPFERKHVPRVARVTSARTGVGTYENRLSCFASLQEAARFCLQRCDDLSGWERSFLRSVLSFKRPSERQLGVIRNIAARAMEAV